MATGERTMRPGGWLLAATVASTLSVGASATPGSSPGLSVETLRSVAALPAHVAGRFRDISACHLTPDGDYLVFDRGSHAVWIVPRAGDAREVVQIGVEPGRLLRPLAFDSATDGTFIIADAPYAVERIQAFFYRGGTTGGFTLPGRSTPRVTLGDFVVSGIGSLEYAGESIFVSQPESGTLITEYSLQGGIQRSFGELRATGHERERDLHVALNAGIPLWLGAKNGFYFVFLSGVPAFRKYDPAGKLLFERHIEGTELDAHVQNLPKVWPTRRTSEGEIPIVPATLRTASVDPDGNLWLSLITGQTYVYDSSGDKRRVLQFQAAGQHSPVNLYFTRDGRLITAPGCYTFRPKG